MGKQLNIENPVMQFITQPAEAKEPRQDAAEQAAAPKGFRMAPEYVETKSRRLQLLIKPSIYAKIKTMARANGVSVNEMINSILEKA